MSDMAHGFVLQPTYRIEDGVPVVLVYGILESGAPFLIRDTRSRPRFHIETRDAARAAEFGAVASPESPSRHNLAGVPVSRVETRIPSEVPPLRDRLHRAGIPTYEADVRFALRYLMDRGLRGSLELPGPGEPAPTGMRLWHDPDPQPSTWTPSLRVLSLDIETDPQGRRLLAVALAGCGVSEVFLFTPPGFAAVPGAASFSSEPELLAAVVKRIRELDPDILTGWNVIDFDLAVLHRMGQAWNVPLTFGRGPEPLRLRPLRGGPGQAATVEGRVVLDGIQLLRGAFVRLESYTLNHAAESLLGKSKTLVDEEGGRLILRLFQEDRDRLVAYNRKDAELVLEILEHLELIPLTVKRSQLTGMPPDRVASSIAAFDYLYLSALHPRGIVAPTTRSESLPAGSGGHVLEPRAGLHESVGLLDFKSLYPSLMRTFQIDPLGHARPGRDPIMAPNGATFSREPGILPSLLDDLMPQRDAAKAAGDAVGSQAIKILMNSFYGVLGTPACRFAHPDLANAITGFGRSLLLWTRDRLEALGYPVLYGDTDSVFVHLPGTPDEAVSLGRDLATRLTRELAAHIRERWEVTSRLELEFEKLYLRLMLPPLRAGGGGARKRYAGWVYREDQEPRLEFVGLEAVRRDWTELARGLQRELYRRVFAGEPVAPLLRSTVEAVRTGQRDPELVYRKAIRKSLDSYTTSTPPHVAAARKRGKPGARTVSYVMTRNGPEPVERRVSPIDYEHYVQRQVRPIAEPVLHLLGETFDRAIGDDRQTDLFPDWPA